ncbi:MAG: NAD(P) transhydrogenase subunit alpha [Methylococcaceae bacterium TMED69]|nr:MAG: NAD(P) transhydrogenase subunit alpha [Methylococcaceae bacterium TMED69]
MKILIAKESIEGECRVSGTPSSVAKLIKLGYEVLVENGAGQLSSFTDKQFQDAGATILSAADWDDADIILKVRGLSGMRSDKLSEVGRIRNDQTVISFVYPSQNKHLLNELNGIDFNLVAMDCVPRISRAQKMDALSSMANIAGYRAVVEAANCFGRFFTGQITAAGKINPAKVLVIGAGVAGLAAIGAARSLGAIVRAFDTRPEVKEQVESMGADFLLLDFEEDGSGSGGYAKVMSDEFIKAEMALFADQAKEVDIIVTTALIPGKPAPTLITQDMVESMKPGSVIVDMAAEQGGNCQLSEADKVVSYKGINIIGYTDLPSRLAAQSSELYATNLVHLLSDMTPEKDGNLKFDLEDEVVRGATVIRSGEVIWPAPPPKLNVAQQSDSQKVEPEEEKNKTEKTSKGFGQIGFLGIIALVIWVLGFFAPADFMAHFTVFVLACFVGYQVIWNVTPALHTPLMSVTNAISGIIVLGAVLQISSNSMVTIILATVSVFIATINIVGGFTVTKRMLQMFQK